MSNTCIGCPWPNDPDCRKKISLKRRHCIEREKSKAEKAMFILQASSERRSLKAYEKRAILKKIHNTAKRLHQSETVTIPLYHNIVGNKPYDIKENLQKLALTFTEDTEDFRLCKRILSAFELAAYYNGCFASAWYTDHGINVKFNFLDKNTLEKFRNHWAHN